MKTSCYRLDRRGVNQRTDREIGATVISICVAPGSNGRRVGSVIPCQQSKGLREEKSWREAP
jgi:hypothetical protein